MPQVSNLSWLNLSFFFLFLYLTLVFNLMYFGTSSWKKSCKNLQKNFNFFFLI